MKNEITFIHSGLVSNVHSLQDELSKVTSGLVCLTTYADQIDKQKLLAAMRHTDVLHCGLFFHQGKPFESVQLCAFNWHFINPNPSVRTISWKPSIEFVVFAKEILNEFGGLDLDYEQPVSALCDFAFRVLSQGGIVTHDPDFIPREKSTHDSNAPLNSNDEGHFVRKFINEEAFKYFRLCNFLLTGKWVKSNKIVPFKKSRKTASKLFSSTYRPDLSQYTAIIPTINRYDYVLKSISSLLSLSVPPSEIIVVDQSPKETRQPEIYSELEQSGKIKVIFLDVPGQSTARNTGIEVARSPWILLFEDDAEAWPEMVNEHMKLLELTQADVSTGVVVIPGQDETFIPEVNRFYFISDILTTGNAFLSKKTALSINGFDPAFDRGPGADDDFGKRLYKNGNVIVYNYKSIETHYKAPKGGMREHGVWWRNTSTLLGAFPPVTQLYSIRKYYSNRYRFFLIFTLLLKARRKYSALSYLYLWLLLPIKYIRSWKATVKLEGMVRKGY